MAMRSTLPARELVGLALEDVRIQADLREKLDHAVLPLRPAHGGMDGQRLPHDVGDALARVERRVRILEHQLHGIATPPKLRAA